MQITIDPSQELPRTLRALALMLSSIASDRDGGKLNAGQVVERTTTHQVGDVSKTVTERLDPNAASGADDQPPPPELDTANDANSTSTTGTAGSGSSSNASGELDKNGLPWDERIHSSAKSKTADGNWKYLRGGDLTLRAKVEAELRAALGDDDQPPPPEDDEEEETPPPPPVEDDAEETHPADAAVDFKQVFARVTALQKHAKGNLLPPELLTQVLELAEVVPPTMGGFMKPENKPKAAAVLDAINALVEGE